MGYLKKKKTETTEPSSPSNPDSTYDLIIIGGGSGGLALSKETSLHGKHVLVLDYVSPSPQGSQWGLGGTCVNVGCIPKKLFHTATLVGETVKEADKFGWEIGHSSQLSSSESTSDSSPHSSHASNLRHNWSALVSSIQSYIRSLNFGYRSRLMKDPNIEYLNMRGKLMKDPNAETNVNASSNDGSVRGVLVEAFDPRSGEKRYFRPRAHIVVAVGGRPRYPPIPGAKEFGITSDDIFSLPQHPGKTLVVGAGYISLETAGFLAGLQPQVTTDTTTSQPANASENGSDVPSSNAAVTVMARSKYLRGFDADMSSKIVEHMRHTCGIRFLDRSIPLRIEKVDDQPNATFADTAAESRPRRPKLRVVYKTTDKDGKHSEQHSEIFDTVLFAIGREPCTNGMGFNDVGVELDSHTAAPGSRAGASGKILVDHPQRDPDESSVSGIYALGDVAKNRPELTPVAIAAAKMLARRLYGCSSSSTGSPSPSPSTSSHHNDTITSTSLQNHLDYASVPTTVFTPLEYSCVGWSEEHARQVLSGKKKHKTKPQKSSTDTGTGTIAATSGQHDAEIAEAAADDDVIDVYHSHFTPLEWSLTDREDNGCYVKVVIQRMHPATRQTIESITDASERRTAFLRAMRSQRVLGLHFLGPNAGEVMQGWSAAFRKGLTREDLEYTIGIHPTVAEELLGLEITKSSGEDPRKTGC